MQNKLINFFSTSAKTLFALLFLLGGFFGFGLTNSAKAGVDCAAEINFSVSPTQVDINKSIIISGWVRSKNYNSQGSTGITDAPGSEGYCNSGLIRSSVHSFLVYVSDNKDQLELVSNPSTNPLTVLNQLVGSYNANPLKNNFIKSVTIPLNKYDNTTKYSFGPWTIDPRSFFYNHKPGESITYYARVLAITITNGYGGILTDASPMTAQIKNQTYACLTDNGSGQYVYACSNGVKSDLSDVPNNACVGKTAQIVDVSQCGKGATIYACVANDGKYACSPGNKKDLSDVKDNSCNGKTTVQISSDKCGQIASISDKTVSPGDKTSGDNGKDTQTTSAWDCVKDPDPNHCIHNPLPENDLLSILLYIMKGFLGIIAIWAVVFIVIGGFKMVMSQGNEEAVTSAKKTITWAILGLVIALLSFAVVAMVQNFIGAKIEEVKTTFENKNII